MGPAAPAVYQTAPQGSLHGPLDRGRLNDYLADIDRQAEEMLFQLVKDYAQRQGITERLKAENQMEWVGRMNSCKAQVEEVIMAELIYT